MSLKNMSQYLKKTPQRLKYSISILEREGFIKNPYCIFDYSYFSLILFRVYFRGSYSNEKEKTKIIKKLSTNPYIISVYELTGEFDLSAEFAAPNPSKFNKEFKKIISAIPTLDNYKIILNIVTHTYPRYYLTKKESFHTFYAERVVGGDREKEAFNKKDKAVIKNLLLNPRMRMTELAKKSQLNMKTVKSILKKFRQKNIIKGFKYTLNTEKIGINKWVLFLRLHNLNLKKELRLMKYIFQTKEIIQLNKTVGDWDMEIYIESLDKNRVREVVMSIREEFKDIVAGFNLIEFYDQYKKSYLPMHLFIESP